MADDPFRPAVELAAAIRRRETTCRHLVELYLDRIERHNPALNAVVTVDAGGARRRADLLDRQVADGGPRGPLHGVPMTVKDAFATKGMRTTSGSEDQRDHVPDGDATAVARLLDAGVVVIGKTNLPAGVTGQETANSIFGRTVNPWDPSRTPGGSSGGAAAAVAAGLTGLGLGSDSGGSIRQPAHCCGVYGHFPTQGLVPLRGHVPLVSLDAMNMQVDLMGAGPLSRHAADLAVALDILAGPDERAGAGWRLALPPPTARARQVRGARVAVWIDEDDLPVEEAVRTCIEQAAEALEHAGAVVDRRARPPWRFADAERAAFDLWVSSTSMSTDEDQFARTRAAAAATPPEDDSLAVRRLRAEVMSHHEWELLDGVRRRLSQGWMRMFDDHDVVLCPVSPVVAVVHDPEPDQVASLDRRLARTIDVDGRRRPCLDQISWNIVVGMAGLPATVAPVGVAPSGLPVGAQIVGPPFGDHTTIAFAQAMADVVGGFRPPPGL